METFKSLKSSPIVQAYEVLDYKTWHGGRYFKLRIDLTNDTLLFAREYLDENERDYSLPLARR